MRPSTWGQAHHSTQSTPDSGRWEDCVWRQVLFTTSVFVVCCVAEAQEPGRAPAHRPAGEVLGGVSCAAASCHGGRHPGQADPQLIAGAEYPLWLERDPHARSWQTLCSDASTAMLERLGILRGGQIVDRAGWANCLACHNPSEHLDPQTHLPPLREGVDCEACHGPAKQWIGEHFLTGWSPQQSASFVPLKDEYQRARRCATCHVGGADRDMNHDLIAAGHPALYFDMAVDHDRLPKHFRDDRLSGAGSSMERIRWWWAGLLAAADAELELLAARARKTHAVSVWPELAAYRCSDCHFALRGPDPGRAHGLKLASSTQGKPAPRGWNLAGLPMVIQTLRADPAMTAWSDRLADRYADLQHALLDSAQQPAAPEVALIAEELRELLSNLRDEGRWSIPHEAQTRSLVAGVLGDPALSGDWESASRAYVAAWSTLSRPMAEDEVEAMESLRQILQFPPGFNSSRFPRGLKSEPWSTSISSEQLREWFSRLAAAVNPVAPSSDLRDTP